MHPNLRKNALAAGFREDQFQIVQSGAEDRAKVEKLTGLGKESVDSVTSVLALCGIPGSKAVIAALYEYLKPGGTFYYFEHVASKEAEVKKRQGEHNLFCSCFSPVRRHGVTVIDAPILQNGHHRRPTHPALAKPLQRLRAKPSHR